MRYLVLRTLVALYQSKHHLRQNVNVTKCSYYYYNRYFYICQPIAESFTLATEHVRLKERY